MRVNQNINIISASGGIISFISSSGGIISIISSSGGIYHSLLQISFNSTLFTHFMSIRCLHLSLKEKKKGWGEGILSLPESHGPTLTFLGNGKLLLRKRINKSGEHFPLTANEKNPAKVSGFPTLFIDSHFPGFFAIMEEVLIDWSRVLRPRFPVALGSAPIAQYPHHSNRIHARAIIRPRAFA